MDKERILRQHEPELKAAGLLHLLLFGSVARGDSTLASDVDLLFDFDELENNILRAYGFQDCVTETIDLPAHLSSANYMRPQIRERVSHETVSVY